MASSRPNARPGESLLQALRTQCGISSVKNGCEPQGQCGCCLAIVDGGPKVTCAMPAEKAAGKEITTLEGVSQEERALFSRAFVARAGVPGPTLEGYLFPETYRFAEGVEPAAVLLEMADRYREYWTLERRARLDSLELDERALVTLASIVEEEARIAEERSIIAGVYSNRLEIGMLLQADPTVQYALGEPKERLLYTDIDRVADHPYNTYTHAGLPPGPISSPGAAALDAALYPADVPYLFFVAEADGSHVFTRTNREHINARNRIRRERGE